MKFRFNRGSLADAMETLVEVNTLQEVYGLSDLKDYGIPNNLTCEYYGPDPRIGWDTHIIKCDGFGVVGFSDGMIERKEIEGCEV